MTKPTMNDFFHLGVPCEVARMAIERWDELSAEERLLLYPEEQPDVLKEYLIRLRRSKINIVTPNENPDLEKVTITLKNPSQVRHEFTNKDVFQTVTGISVDSRTNI